VSASEKTDDRQEESGFRDVPQGDSCRMYVRGNLQSGTALRIGSATLLSPRFFAADKSHSDKPGNSLSAALIRQGIENLSVKAGDGQSTPGDKSVSIFSGNRTQAKKCEEDTNHHGKIIYFSARMTWSEKSVNSTFT
jgi:hypothetical protein